MPADQTVHRLCRSFQQTEQRVSGRAETQKFCLTGSPPLPIVAPRCTSEYATKKYGEVSEWLKEHAWKVCIRVSVSRVRTPPSPPYFMKKPERKFRLFCCLPSASVCAASGDLRLHHGAAPVAWGLTELAFKTAIEGLLRVKAE